MGSACMEDHKPSMPHWYVQILATSGKWRGQNCASKLLAIVHEWAKRDEVCCYLETSLETVPFYIRNGYRVVWKEALSVSDTGPTHVICGLEKYPGIPTASSMKLHQRPGSTGFAPAHPSPGHDQLPWKDHDSPKKDEKDEDEKADTPKEKQEKAPKEQKQKDKKGKPRDLHDSDSRSDTQKQRHGDAGRQLLVAAFGRF